MRIKTSKAYRTGGWKGRGDPSRVMDLWVLAYGGMLPHPYHRVTAEAPPPSDTVDPSFERGSDTERDIERRIATQVLFQSLRDYHCAKHIIKKHNVAFKYHCRRTLDFLTREQRNTVMAGKEAWEWFINPPIEGEQTKYTLERCCELLGLKVDQVRVDALKPLAAKALKAGNHPAYPRAA